MTMENWIQSKFGVSQDIFLEAIALSPSSQGYIYGAISEILLNSYLRENGFTNAKGDDALASHIAAARKGKRKSVAKFRWAYAI